MAPLPHARAHPHARNQAMLSTAPRLTPTLTHARRHAAVAAAPSPAHLVATRSGAHPGPTSSGRGSGVGLSSGGSGWRADHGRMSDQTTPQDPRSQHADPE